MVKELLILLIGSSLVSNVVLSQFLGLCPFLGVSNKMSTATGMSVAVIFVMTMASAICWVINTYLLIPLGLKFMQTVAYILVIAVLVQFVEMFLKKMAPSIYTALGIYLPLITTNCAVLGAALLNIQKGYSFGESVAFGFASALGFTMAILIFAGVRERLAIATPPKCFRGFPILLISASLAAMAFAGFSGMKLG